MAPTTVVAALLLLIGAVSGKLSEKDKKFAAEIARQCLVKDPVAVLQCVVDRTRLPYLEGWVECIANVGGTVATVEEIIKYRCTTVWEGKGVIPEIFYIRDCVIARTGLPAANVSAEIFAFYNQCEEELGANEGTKAPIKLASPPSPPAVAPPFRPPSYPLPIIPASWIAPRFPATFVVPGVPATHLTPVIPSPFSQVVVANNGQTPGGFSGYAYYIQHPGAYTQFVQSYRKP